MADITVRDQGNVSDEGQVNWRGDQVSVVQGGQSVFDSSSIQLTDLGSRKVVGDRVFRYAKTRGTIAAGMVIQYGGESLSSIAVGGAVTQPAGLKIFTITAVTAISPNTYADGYLCCSQGSTDGNKGMLYKIKSNALGASAGTCVLTLYDPIKFSVSLTSTWNVAQNLYMNVKPATADGAVVGVAPIAVTTGDYFWIQTWGPGTLQGNVAAGSGLVAAVSGDAAVMAATASPIGEFILVGTATGKALAFIKITP